MRSADDSPWSAPGTVAGFAQAPPNDVLVRFAETELARGGNGHALDLGCGAGRNAVPLAHLGWDVLGIDNSTAMLEVAVRRARLAGVEERVRFALSPMDRLAAADQAFDLVVAHGIWNLARTSDEFRRAVREAARVSRPGAGLFVFTFSRHTLPVEAEPVAGEAFVFTQFSGQPQCFLTEEQLVAELADAGFSPESSVPRSEYNRPRAGTLVVGSTPVIHEAAFRRER